MSIEIEKMINEQIEDYKRVNNAATEITGCYSEKDYKHEGRLIIKIGDHVYFVPCNEEQEIWKIEMNFGSLLHRVMYDRSEQ